MQQIKIVSTNSAKETERRVNELLAKGDWYLTPSAFRVSSHGDEDNFSVMIIDYNFGGRNVQTTK